MRYIEKYKQNSVFYFYFTKFHDQVLFFFRQDRKRRGQNCENQKTPISLFYDQIKLKFIYRKFLKQLQNYLNIRIHKMNYEKYYERLIENLNK